MNSYFVQDVGNYTQNIVTDNSPHMVKVWNAICWTIDQDIGENVQFWLKPSPLVSIVLKN